MAQWMIKEDTGPRNSSFWKNETREKRQAETASSEIQWGFPFSEHYPAFYFLREEKEEEEEEDGKPLSLVSLWRWEERLHNHLPLIASLTPESCRFLTDILYVRWRRSNGGDFGADENEQPYQIWGAPWCRTGEEWADFSCLTRHRFLFFFYSSDDQKPSLLLLNKA